jgi:hypothetical protein
MIEIREYDQSEETRDSRIDGRWRQKRGLIQYRSSSQSSIYINNAHRAQW